MTEEDLATIEARAERATAGPWEASANYLIGGWWVQDPVAKDREGEVLDGGSEADCVFVAHARSDVPALVAEVRRLRAALTRSEQAHAADAEMPGPGRDGV